ncbi:hypothetical protein [Bacillus niameyensis]|uniref:hypothetical protein n=1 Tax=Bacillus niameyensis TaxID=1522308 RepID=UPI001E3F2683|nr:hypothetical protein [Bacillus niameyensis]
MIVYVYLNLVCNGGEQEVKLPNGITGFYNSKVNTPPPQVDWRQFKQLCFDVAIRSGGKVIDFKSPRYTENFYYAQVKILDNQFYILLNEHFPYLAFASVVEFGNIKFIDEPFIYEQFSPFYQVLKSVELNAPFNQNLVKPTELNNAELEQISYWKPETIGQLIFNYWD